MMIRAIKVVLLLTAICTSGVAQPYVSARGLFEVDQRMGCVPFSVNITVYDCSPSCDVDLYHDGNFVTVNSPHTYDRTGTFWMRVLIGAGNIDSLQITVFPAIQPAFNLYACGNNEVTVDITDTNYDEYAVNFNDGSPEVIVTAGASQHTYASPGPESVTVRGRKQGAADNCSDSTRTINALQALPPPLLTGLQVLDNTSLQVNFDGRDNILYRLEIATNGKTNFQLYKTLYNVDTDIVTNLRTDDNYYCFRLGTVDPCANTTIYSPVMCSADLDLSVENNSNLLTWTTDPSASLRLTSSIDGSSITTDVTGDTSYRDTDVTCGTEYCYYLTAIYPGGYESVSILECGTAFSTDEPGPVADITAVVGEQGVNLLWQLVPGFDAGEFAVHKTVNDVTTRLGASATPEFFDETYLTESGACYRISYGDICGNDSPLSEPACPIRLTATLEADNTISLAWSAYQGWRDGVAGYVIEKYSPEGQLLASTDAGTALGAADDSQDLANQLYVFVVKANPSNAVLPQAVSNRVVIIKDPNLFYPTGFTPNGDNLNDLFNVFGQYIIDFEMNIFNRWGELLYTTADLEQGWDGTFRGNPMPEGTYTFVADITDRAGRTFRKSGSVLLIRKGN